MSVQRMLARNHTHLITASGISEDVAEARGYRTISTKIELRRLGFSDGQACAPALLLPVHSVTGETPFFQIRPDQPRVVRGKALKYETPSGARMAVDVPPSCRSSLGDPARPLFITEGIRKADSAASIGLCAVDLIGVWNWRGTNEQGGKTLLADFEMIACNNREIYMCFDSDVMLKPQVQAACDRLSAVVRTRGADVRFVLLPALPDGSKQGLDDFLAAGHTVDDLIRLSRPELPDIEREDDDTAVYVVKSGGLIWRKPTRDGHIETPLTNFEARIVADVTEDDGSEVRRAFEIEAHLRGRSRRFLVSESRFAGLSWATEQLGASAIVYPGFGTRDHARAAIQLLSGDVPNRYVYAHTGWRDIDGTRCYLHAGGAIGAAGVLGGVAITLPSGMDGFALPAPPNDDDLTEAIRASLGMLAVGPARIVYPIVAAVYRAAAGPMDASLHLAGPTGEGKSELAALAQQHYGPAMTARNLPGSWDSTANALEALTFAAKDALFVVDDFMPNARGADAHRLHRDADRLLRAKGNHAGRQRMRADTTLRPAKPPRALILSTGEDIPRGQSLRARMLILELAPGELHWSTLTRCQRDAAEGQYAAAMAGFVRWLADRFPNTVGTSALLREDALRFREIASDSMSHRRTPEIAASLAVGFKLFLDFAMYYGAITPTEAAAHWQTGWNAFGDAVHAQAIHQSAAEPAGRFIELVASALASGRVHVAAPDGGVPVNAIAWGWRIVHVGTGEYQRDDWRPQGERIGWVDGEAVYLDRDASHAAARRFAGDTGDAFTITRDTLAKRMHERGLLSSTEAQHGELSVRRSLEGRRRRVWYLSAAALCPPEESGQFGQDSKSRAHWPDGWPYLPAEVTSVSEGIDRQDPCTGGDDQRLGRIGRIIDTVANTCERDDVRTTQLWPDSGRNPAPGSAIDSAGSKAAAESDYCLSCGRVLPNAAARALGQCSVCGGSHSVHRKNG